MLLNQAQTQSHPRSNQELRPSSPLQLKQQLNSARRLSRKSERTVHGLQGGTLTSLSPNKHLNLQTHQLFPRTVDSSSSASVISTDVPAHGRLLVEPILLPSLRHVHVESQQDLEESCLFYPNGHKNRNIRREIESNMVKQHFLENCRSSLSKKPKTRYRLARKDAYESAKGPPLFYSKPADPVMQQLYSSVRDAEGRIMRTVQVIV
jgi:hypothetical protein